MTGSLPDVLSLNAGILGGPLDSLSSPPDSSSRTACRHLKDGQEIQESAEKTGKKHPKRQEESQENIFKREWIVSDRRHF